MSYKLIGCPFCPDIMRHMSEYTCKHNQRFIMKIQIQIHMKLLMNVIM